MLKAITVSAVTVLLALSAAAQPLTLTYPGYSVSVSDVPGRNPDAAFLPVVSAKLDTLARNQRDARFGILFRGAPGIPADAVVFTFIDASTGATIREMTAAAYNGGAVDGIRPLPGRSVRRDSVRVDAFTVTGPAGSFVAFRTVAIVADTTMPGGSFLSLDWSIESPADRQVRIVLSGPVEGSVSGAGNAVFISPAASFQTFRPQIAIVGPQGAQADVVPATGTTQARITLTGAPVRVQANRSASVFRVSIVGTTVGIAEFISRQSMNLTARLNGAAPAPGMITRTFVDKPNPMPGDTVTYRIVFHNIGTAPAVGVVLTNPIPDRVTYLEGSATGADADIVIHESEPEPPQASVVEDIAWTFLSNIQPGGERWTSFKVIIQ